jgi:hypothetical protein
MTGRDSDYAAFHVPWSTHALAGFVHRFRRLWIALGDLETWSLAEPLQNIAIDRPIYIAGMARSGSTILLEALAAHPDAATHKYKDFPCLFTPCWWDRAQPNAAASAARQRAHADGIAVTPDSPEAMEEMLWMAFFPQLHDPRVSNVLDGAAARPRFEAFYRDHLRKLLLARGGRRYVSKGNYNLTRLPYLLKLFPDARFIVPVRQPESHLASLVKQHRLFCRGETAHPRALEYMRRVGHFEFGLDRRPICAGDPAAAQSILDLWRQGEEVRGWARSWATLYGWLADQLARDEKLREATLVVRYEDFCDSPAETLHRVLDHAALDPDPAVAAFADRIQAPGYYRPDFSAEDLEVIADETAAVAERFDYPPLSLIGAVDRGVEVC